MLGQQQQGQQLAGLGPGMIPQQAPDGLMVATPAQTLTDTLDDIMAGEWMSCCSLFMLVFSRYMQVSAESHIFVFFV